MFKGKNIVLVSILTLMFLLQVEYFPVPATSSTSTTQYVTLTINIYGNGNLTVETPLNCTTINKTTTFIIPIGSLVLLSSNQSFWAGNGTVITKSLSFKITHNTTLNIYFNISNFVYPPSYAKVVMNVEGHLDLDIYIVNYIFNEHFDLAYFQINNSSATFFAPINSSIIISSNKEFYVNGTPAENFTFQYVYQYNITRSTTITLVISTTENSTTTSTTLPRTTVITLPVPNTTITVTPHTGTVIPTSTASRSPLAMYYAILAVVVVILVAFFVLRRVRK